MGWTEPSRHRAVAGRSTPGRGKSVEGVFPHDAGDPLHKLRLLLGEVGPFAGVRFQVVELDLRGAGGDAGADAFVPADADGLPLSLPVAGTLNPARRA